MSVQNVSAVNKNNFKDNSTDNKTTSVQPQSNIKDGKKKLALALGGLAIAGTATFVLYKTGKLNGIIDSLKQLKNKNKLKGYMNKDTVGTSIKPDLSKPKIDTVLGPVSSASTNNVSTPINRTANNKLQTKEISIADELMSRNKTKQQIEHARKTQDELIEVMQNPSGMTKTQRQELVNSLERNLNAKDKITEEMVVTQPKKEIQKASAKVARQENTYIKPTTKTKKTYSNKLETIEIKGKGGLKHEQVSEMHWKFIDGYSSTATIDATKQPGKRPLYAPDFDNVSYTKGDEKYTINLNTGSQKLKTKQANGKFKTIKRETSDKVISHLEDGTTQVFNKNNRMFTVYDKKGTIINEFQAETAERSKVAIALTNSGREVEEIISGETIKNADISGVKNPYLDTKTLSKWVHDAYFRVIHLGKLK